MDLKQSLGRFTEEIEIRYIAAGVFILLGLGLIMASQPQAPGSQGEGQISVNLTVDFRDSVDSNMVDVRNSSTVLQALNASYPVEYRESSYGYFITSIDGVSGNETEYWIYEVNGETPEKGVGKYRLSDEDRIRFTLMSEQEGEEAVS